MPAARRMRGCYDDYHAGKSATHWHAMRMLRKTHKSV
jgi:hypothetical protein